MDFELEMLSGLAIQGGVDGERMGMVCSAGKGSTACRCMLGRTLQTPAPFVGGHSLIC